MPRRVAIVSDMPTFPSAPPPCSPRLMVGVRMDTGYWRQIRKQVSWRKEKEERREKE